MSNKSVEFHIKSGDYFGTLATIFSLIKQSTECSKISIKTLESIIKDLLYLQKEYKIIKK